ncbi:MAG: rubrerythrin, partial [Elusimicrobia bacterium CG06_land_8_20_14_3_00_38_11]
MEKVDSLEFALDFEINGTILYLKLAKKTKNILIKQLFYSLASQEIDHAKRVDEIYEMVKENKEWEVLGERNLSSIEITLKDFFRKAKKINLKRDIENLSGYKIAMEMEEKGYNA